MGESDMDTANNGAAAGDDSKKDWKQTTLSAAFINPRELNRVLKQEFSGQYTLKVSTT
jgi:hypothetical protein